MRPFRDRCGARGSKRRVPSADELAGLFDDAPAGAPVTSGRGHSYEDGWFVAEPQPGGACGRVIEMLKETAELPAQRMTRHLCQPRRRGGWRRNRPNDKQP